MADDEDYGVEQPVEPAADEPVGDEPIDPELYDHNDAKRRLKQLKTEQEVRRKRMEEVRKRDEEQLREQMKVDEAKMQARMQEREIEMQRQKEERMARYRREREMRQQERQQFRQKQKSNAPSNVPLYKRREEEFKKKLDDEEAARREELKKKREAYEPIDFVKLTTEAVEREQTLREAREARRAARLEAEREATLSLPPLQNYYAGKVHERIVQEQHEAKRKNEIARDKAKKMHDKAQRYAKLVAELDPARACCAGKAGEGKGATAAGGAPRAAGSGAAAAAASRGGRPTRRPQQQSHSDSSLAGADFVPSAQTNELQAKLSELDLKIGSKEQAQGKLKKGTGTLDEMLQIRTDLSSLYIDAIKYKVELLHAIRTQRSSSAPVAAE